MMLDCMQYPFAQGSMPEIISLEGGEGEKREGLDTVPALFSNSQNTAMLSTLCFFKPQIQNTALYRLL